MAQELELYEKCPQCNGTGIFQSASNEEAEPIVCNWPGCVDGFIPRAKMTVDPSADDIIDKCDDIIGKCNDILEKLNE